jgi:hypothetical protein
MPAEFLRWLDWNTNGGVCLVRKTHRNSRCISFAAAIAGKKNAGFPNQETIWLSLERFLIKSYPAPGIPSGAEQAAKKVCFQAKRPKNIPPGLKAC